MTTYRTIKTKIAPSKFTKLNNDQQVSLDILARICLELNCVFDDIVEIENRRKRGLKVADKNNANIGFEKQIWDAACVLWGHIPAAEYRKVIIGLIFLRYISAAFDKRYRELVDEGDGFEDDIDAYTMENVFLFQRKLGGQR